MIKYAVYTVIAMIVLAGLAYVGDNDYQAEVKAQNEYVGAVRLGYMPDYKGLLVNQDD